jgi:hypothetical protein
VQAAGQGLDIKFIRALQMKVDKLKALKPNLNLISLAEQVMSKTELFIQTHNKPRAEALAADGDMNGFRSFKELIVDLKKDMEELSPKSDSFEKIEKIDISLKDFMPSSKFKVVKLTQRVSDGTKSSNKSIIVNAEYKGLQVKVKLRNDRDALLREYSIMKLLNIKAPSYFMRPFELVCYDNGELVPSDGCYDDLSGLHWIIMKAYSQMNFRKPNFQIGFKSVGFEIIKTAHSKKMCSWTSSLLILFEFSMMMEQSIIKPLISTKPSI